MFAVDMSAFARFRVRSAAAADANKLIFIANLLAHHRLMQLK
jgi:predicted MarR family transcription regulator